MTTFPKAHWLVVSVAAVLMTYQTLGAANSAVLGPSGHQLQSIPPELSLRIQPVQDVVQADSPVKVAFAATNSTDHLIQYSCWVVIPCGLEVHDQTGNEPPETQLHRRFGVAESPNVAVEELIMGTPGGSALQPGETKTYVIDIDGWYDLSQPGAYTVQVVQIGFNGEILLKSNLITVKVAPAATTQPAPTAGTPSSPPPFTLEIRMDSKPGFPVGLTVRTTNTSHQRIRLRTDKVTTEHVGSIYKVEVHDNTGAFPPDTDFGRLAKNRDLSPPPPLSPITPPGDGLSLSLKPGETWADSIMLNKVYALNKPGQYNIQVRRWDDQTQTWVESNTVTVTVDGLGRVQ